MTSVYNDKQPQGSLRQGKLSLGVGIHSRAGAEIGARPSLLSDPLPRGCWWAVDFFRDGWWWTTCGFCSALVRFRRPPRMTIYCSRECLAAHESGLEDRLRAIPMPPEEK